MKGRRSQLIAATTSLLMLAASCSGTSKEATVPTSTTSGATTTNTALTVTTTTTTATPASSNPTTTATPTTAATTSSTAATTTTTADTTPTDSTPPPAPTGVTCGAGAGSGEFDLDWDAPADPADVAGINLYISESGGSFTRLSKLPLSGGMVDTSLSGGSRWGATAYPIPTAVPIQLAVTAWDSAGNESGWYPIDAYFAGAATPCNSGPPPAISDLVIWHGAGSGEIEAVFTPPALDVVEYRVEADTGSGMNPLTVTVVLPSSTPSQIQVVATWADWYTPTTYRVTPVDAHGNAGPSVDRSCPPIPGFDDHC